MKDKLISDKLSDNQMLEDLQRLLDEELAKPLEERDLDAVEEITNAIVSINDEDIPKPVSAETVLAEASARKKRGRIIHLRKWAAALTACIAICIAANLYTVNTFGAGLIETVMKIARSGFSVDLNDLRDIEPTTTQLPLSPPETGTTVPMGTTTVTTTAVMASGTYGLTTVPGAVITTTQAQIPGGDTPPTATGDPVIDSCDPSAQEVARGMITKCREHDIYPFYPESLPEYFSALALEDSHFEQMKDSKDMYLTFSDGVCSMDVIIEEYVSSEVMPEVLIPSDDYEYQVFTGEYFSGIVIEEDRYTTIVFVQDNTVYTIHGTLYDAGLWTDAVKSFVPYPSEYIKK